MEKGLTVLQVNAFHISMAPDFIVSFSDKEGMHYFQKLKIGLKVVDNAETIEDKESGHMSLFCHHSSADNEWTMNKARDNYVNGR